MSIIKILYLFRSPIYIHVCIESILKLYMYMCIVCCVDYQGNFCPDLRNLLESGRSCFCGCEVETLPEVILQ